MGKDLSNDLATDLAQDLAQNLAGGSPYAGFSTVAEHWEAEYGRTMATGVSAWAGRIDPDNNVLSQGTGSEQPTYNAASGAGRPALVFDAGASQTLAGAAALAAQCEDGEFAIFMLIRPTSDVGTENIGGFGSSVTGNIFCKALVGGGDFLTARYRGGGDIMIFGDTTAFPETHWIMMANTGTTFYHATDLDAESTDDSTGITISDAHFLFGSEPDSNPSAPYEGEIIEIVVCTACPGAAERAAIGALMSSRGST